MKNEKISECPEELDGLITKINLLPQDWDKFLSDAAKLIQQRETEVRAASERNKVLSQKFYSGYGKKFRSLIDPKLAERMERKPEKAGLINARFELQVLNAQNLALRNVINLFQQFEEFNNPEQAFELDDIKLDKFGINEERPNEIKLDKNLKVISFNSDSSVKLFGVLEILTRNKIPVKRVRVCPICKNIFWAKRIESPACSDSHVNTFNARKTRIRKLENEFHQQLEKLEKARSRFNETHPLVVDQLEIVKKLQEKVKLRRRKNGTL